MGNPLLVPKTETAKTWRVVGAAVQGVSHLKQRLPCQDAQGYRLLSIGASSILIVALADGAGTAARSEEGARLAVDRSLSALEAGINEGLPQDDDSWRCLIQSALESARQSVLELAEETGASARNFAATLTCAVTAGDRLAIGQIGDCTLVAAMDVSAGELEALAKEELESGQQELEALQPRGLFEDSTVEIAAEAETERPVWAGQAGDAPKDFDAPASESSWSDSQEAETWNYTEESLADFSAPVTQPAEASPQQAPTPQRFDVTQAPRWEGAILLTTTRAQRGEYANETFFLTQEDALERAVVRLIHGRVRALALMSDGLLRLALQLPSYQPHLPFFEPLFAFASAMNGVSAGGSPNGQADNGRYTAQLEAFLSSQRVNARTDDDKSIILAVASPR